MNWETVACFGDSITNGARTYLGYPEYLGSILKEKLGKDWNIINHAENGRTAIDLARSMDLRFQEILSASPLLSVILIGTNDAKGPTPPETFAIAMEQVILKAKLVTNGHNVLLLGIPQFPIGVMYPYKTEMNTIIASYNQVLLSKSEEHNIDFLDLNLREEHFFDGVHLNEAGNEFLAGCVAKYILDQRGIAIG